MSISIASVRPIDIKPHDIKNRTRASSSTAHSSQSKCKASGYKAPQYQQQKTKKTDMWQTWYDVWHDLCFMMFSQLDVPVCLWVLMKQNICIQLKLDCINDSYRIL
jgi:hypothetical protein